MQRIDSLQIFRGIAAILVVLFHLTGFISERHGFVFFNGLFSNGRFGVDLFFVLSGFIIFYIHRKDIGHKERFGGYMLKRIKRIYPIYWIVTLLVIPIYYVLSTLGEGGLNFAFIIKSLLLFPMDSGPLVTVGWTLSHEMFFYLLFGLFILMGRKYAFGIATILLVSSIVILVASIDTPFLISFIFSKYNLEFFLGCLAAYISTRHDIKYPSLFMWGGILIFGVAMSTWYHPILIGDPIFYFGLASFLIILGGSKVNVPRNSLTSFFIFLGNASFSIYLTHYTLMLISGKVLKPLIASDLLFSWLVLIIELFGSILFYLVIERNLTKYLSKSKIQIEFTGNKATSRV